MFNVFDGSWVNKGWQCPVCGAVFAPHAYQCSNCVPYKSVTTDKIVPLQPVPEKPVPGTTAPIYYHRACTKCGHLRPPDQLDVNGACAGSCSLPYIPGTPGPTVMWRTPSSTARSL